MSSRAVSRERRRERRGAAHRAKQSSESASRPAARIRRGHRPSWVVPELQPAGRRWTSGSVPGRRAREGLGSQQPAGGAASRISGWLAASTGPGGRASHVMHRLRCGPVCSACSGLRVCAVADCRYAPYRAAATCCSAVWHLVGDAQGGQNFTAVSESGDCCAAHCQGPRPISGSGRPGAAQRPPLKFPSQHPESGPERCTTDCGKLPAARAPAGVGRAGAAGPGLGRIPARHARRGPPGRVAACAAWQLGRVGARDEEPCIGRPNHGSQPRDGRPVWQSPCARRSR